MQISITRVDNGWIVRAGCITLVFGKEAHGEGALSAEFSRWLANPEQVEKEYAARYRENTPAVQTPAQIGEVAGYTPRF